MRSLLRRGFLIAQLVWLATAGRAAAAGVGLPLVRTFNAADIPIRGGVWALARTPDGTLMVGSGKLAAFDGQVWRDLSIPGCTVFRALVSDASGTVWVGGPRLLGRLRRDAAGLWRYTSLLPQLTARGMDFPREVLSAHLTADGVVFVTPEGLLRCDKERLALFPFPTLLHAFSLGGELYVFSGKSVFRLGRSGLQLVWSAAELPPGTPVWIAQLDASFGRPPTIFLGTPDGVYRHDGKVWNYLPDASAVLKDKLGVAAMPADRTTLAIATLKAGVFLLSTKGEIVGAVDTTRGLPDDSVYTLLNPEPGFLWAGTGNGVALLQAIGTGTMINRRAWLGDGVPRGVIAEGDHLLLRTTKGLWRLGLHGENPVRLTAETGPEEPTTAVQPSISKVGRRIFALTDRGIFSQAADGSTGPPPGFAAGFAGLAATNADPSGNVYWVLRGQSLDTPVVVRLHPSAEPAGLEWTPLWTPGIERIGAVSCASFTPATPAHGERLWIGGSEGVLEFDLGKLERAPAPPAVRLLRVGLEHADLFKETARLPPEITSKMGSELALAPPDTPTLAPGDLTIRFSFAGERMTEGLQLYYQTQLEPIEPAWSASGREPRREFTGLAPGRYLFRVRALDAFGRSGPPATYPFVIAAPWYLRPGFWIGAAAALALVFAGLVRWRLSRLRRQNQRLDALVRARTRQLEMANTAKGEFLENISHELRNPLNGIVGLASMFREELLPAREQGIAQSLKVCAAHLQRLAEEVLGFSKLEYGGAALETARFRLASVLDEAVGLHRALGERTATPLQVVLPANFTDGFKGDAGKLRTIVSNFVSNALRHAPGKPVTISVEVEADGDRPSVTIEVRDQGPGVPKEEQELIFQKFARGNEAKLRGVVGTGLGLAACRMLALRMGGHVGVDSSGRDGATFYLQLSLQRCESRVDAASLASALPDLGPLSTLIVEDEEYNRIILGGIVEELGAVAVLASDASSALAAVEQQSFAVVFLDWELSGGTGGQVAETIRRRPGGEKPIIIATTAHDSDTVRQKCRASGMDGFLLKPYGAAGVRAAIQAERQKRANLAGAPLDFLALNYYGRGSPQRAGRETDDLLAALSAKIAELMHAAAQGGGDRLVAAAHALRSLTGVVGARELNQAARDLEVNGGTATTPQLQPYLRSVEAQWAKLKARIG